MRKEVKILGIISVVVIIAVIVGASYYRQSSQTERIGTGANSNRTSVPAGELVRPDSPTLGSADAPVTVVEFYDPECEACAAFAPIVKKILKDYEGRIRLVVRYMPLHPNSMKAAMLTEAAGEQGKYWQMQELLFQKQSEWGEKHGPADAASQGQPSINVLFEKYAMELGLDLDKLDAAVKENRFMAKISRDQKDGQNLGVRSTPTFFVNGRKLARLGDQELRALIDEELRR
ncbi:MAG TPA: DsbA family protein [Pyrinomonadaceae bacterium]|nr:DsbA family protein [Pyrinomonadaceae bacterium]